MIAGKSAFIGSRVGARPALGSLKTAYSSASQGIPSQAHHSSSPKVKAWISEPVEALRQVCVEARQRHDMRAVLF
jgi:hypothetical protein